MRILIADDSAIVRAILEQNLKKMDPEIEVTASLSTGRKALDSARTNPPDIAILDSDMPEMSGIEAAEELHKELNIPSIVLCENPSEQLSAKAAGAKGIIHKPDVKDYSSSFFESLLGMMKTYAKKHIHVPETAKKKISLDDIVLPSDGTVSSATHTSDSDSVHTSKIKIVCLGASTGGPTAVQSVLSGLGNNFPLPIIYSQHVEIGDDEKMANWLDDACPNIKVKLAKDGEEAVAGTVYMAPADKHLVINFVKPNGNPVLAISNDPPERFLRPAVNKMFVSASKHYRTNCLAVLLTGMGRDGADGCKAIVDAGGYTICEDKSTCAVFGMPAAAIEIGGAKEVLPRTKIPARILWLTKS